MINRRSKSFSTALAANKAIVKELRPCTLYNAAWCGLVDIKMKKK